MAVAQPTARRQAATVGRPAHAGAACSAGCGGGRTGTCDKAVAESSVKARCPAGWRGAWGCAVGDAVEYGANGRPGDSVRFTSGAEVQPRYLLEGRLRSG